MFNPLISLPLQFEDSLRRWEKLENNVTSKKYEKGMNELIPQFEAVLKACKEGGGYVLGEVREILKEHAGCLYFMGAPPHNRNNYNVRLYSLTREMRKLCDKFTLEHPDRYLREYLWRYVKYGNDYTFHFISKLNYLSPEHYKAELDDILREAREYIESETHISSLDDIVPKGETFESYYFKDEKFDYHTAGRYYLRNEDKKDVKLYIYTL